MSLEGATSRRSATTTYADHADAAFPWTKAEARREVARALRFAMRRTGASRATAGKWCKKSVRTMQSWANEQAPVDVEAVMRSVHLRGPFLAYLTKSSASGGVTAEDD